MASGHFTFIMTNHLAGAPPTKISSLGHAPRKRSADDSSLVPVPHDQERKRWQQAAAKRNGVQPKGLASVHARVHVVGRHAVETWSYHAREPDKLGLT